jgi:hypothetical protein
MNKELNIYNNNIIKSNGVNKMEKLDLNEYLQKAVVSIYIVKGTLHNIHGEHDERELDKKTTVHTFPKNDEGELLVPLGGERGYIMGALRYSLYDLYKDQLSNRRWVGYGIKTMLEHGVFIRPKWISVGKKISNLLSKPKKYLVQAKGSGGNMFPVYYDYVDKANFMLTIEITNPKIPEDIFLCMLAHIQRLGIGPKRRAKINFTVERGNNGD